MLSQSFSRASNYGERVSSFYLPAMPVVKVRVVFPVPIHLAHFLCPLSLLTSSFHPTCTNQVVSVVSNIDDCDQDISPFRSKKMAAKSAAAKVRIAYFVAQQRIDCCYNARTTTATAPQPQEEEEQQGAAAKPAGPPVDDQLSQEEEEQQGAAAEPVGAAMDDQLPQEEEEKQGTAAEPAGAAVDDQQLQEEEEEEVEDGIESDRDRNSDSGSGSGSIGSGGGESGSDGGGEAQDFGNVHPRITFVVPPEHRSQCSWSEDDLAALDDDIDAATEVDRNWLLQESARTGDMRSLLNSQGTCKDLRPLHDGLFVRLLRQCFLQVEDNCTLTGVWFDALQARVRSGSRFTIPFSRNA